MAIEFSCPHCGKELKTTDDKAGLTARCPDCSGTVTVPGLAPADSPVDPADPWAASPVSQAAAWNAPGNAPDVDAAEDGRTADVAPGDMKTCPMCGQQVKAVARVCRHCGERLEGPPDSRTVEPTPVESGVIINVSWELFKKHGVIICVACFIVAIIPGVLNQILQIGVNVAFEAAGAGQFGAVQMAIVGSVLFVMYLAEIALQTYMNLGEYIFLLNVAKGRNPELGDLFKGGPFLLRALGGMLLIALPLGVLAGLCAVPSVLAFVAEAPEVGIALAVAGVGVMTAVTIFVQLRFMPAYYHLVEQDSTITECLRSAWEITRPNLLTQFVISFVMMMALFFLGVIMCCFGLLVTLPLYSTMQAVAYVMMCGRRIVVVD